MFVCVGCSFDCAAARLSHTRCTLVSHSFYLPLHRHTLPHLPHLATPATPATPAQSSRNLAAAPIPEEYHEADITLTFPDEMPITLSTEDVKKLGPDQLSAYFREFVSRLGGVMMAAGQNPNGPEAESVNRLTSELVWFAVGRHKQDTCLCLWCVAWWQNHGVLLTL